MLHKTDPQHNHVDNDNPASPAFPGKQKKKAEPQKRGKDTARGTSQPTREHLVQTLFHRWGRDLETPEDTQVVAVGTRTSFPFNVTERKETDEEFIDLPGQGQTPDSRSCEEKCLWGRKPFLDSQEPWVFRVPVTLG